MHQARRWGQLASLFLATDDLGLVLYHQDKSPEEEAWGTPP